MPTKFRLPGARLVSSRGAVFCLAGTGAVLAILLLGGRFLYVEDPLQPSDAILVFSGTFAERPLEAGELYRSGYAPLIVLTREVPDGGQRWLARRGIAIPDRADAARDLLLRRGVPAGAVMIPAAANDSTADEASVFASLIHSHHWRCVIVVTSKMHTRRARMALKHAVNDGGVTVLVRASRFDDADPAQWWRRRADARALVIELEKYVAYWIGSMR